MLTTEQDAKQKWCPHAIASHTDPRAGFRGPSDPSGVMQFPCIASVCMAWRWADTFNADAQTAFEAACPTGASMGCEVVGPQPVGYCGLAGKPEEAESC